MITTENNSITIKPSSSGAMTGALVGIRIGSVIPMIGPTVCGITGSLIGFIYGPAD